MDALVSYNLWDASGIILPTSCYYATSFLDYELFWTGHTNLWGGVHNLVAF